MSNSTDQRALWLARNILPHEPSLRAWLAARRIDTLDVDDIIQESYAKLIRVQSVDHIRNPRNYFYQIAHSVILSHLRRANVVPIHAVANLESLGAASAEPTPDEHAAGRDELRRLGEAIAAMPPQVRRVFVLRRVEGLSQREVASCLGLAESTVEKHMSKGFHFLMDFLGRGGKAAPVASNSRNGYARPSYAKRAEPRD